jgi:hypothetical protein
MALTIDVLEYRVAVLMTTCIVTGALGTAAVFTTIFASEENSTAQAFAAAAQLGAATGTLAIGLWYPFKSLVKGVFCSERSEYTELPSGNP